MPEKNRDPLVAKFTGHTGTPGKNEVADSNALAKTNNLVMLSIVGNPHCQGDYITAMTKRASIYKKMTFLIVDELQRHNLCFEQNASNDHNLHYSDMANAKGDAFIMANYPYFIEILPEEERDGIKKILASCDADKVIDTLNEHLLDKYKIEVVRWKKWVALCDYKSECGVLEEMFSSNPKLKNALAISAGKFVERQKIKSEGKEEALFASEAFLREEVCNIGLVGFKLGYDFLSYPGDMPRVFKVCLETIKEKFFHDAATSYLKWLHIRFADSRPQQPTSGRFFSAASPPPVFPDVTSPTQQRQCEILYWAIFSSEQGLSMPTGLRITVIKKLLKDIAPENTESHTRSTNTSPNL